MVPQCTCIKFNIFQIWHFYDQMYPIQTPIISDYPFNLIMCKIAQVYLTWCKSISQSLTKRMSICMWIYIFPSNVLKYYWLMAEWLPFYRFPFSLWTLVLFCAIGTTPIIHSRGIRILFSLLVLSLPPVVLLLWLVYRRVLDPLSLRSKCFAYKSVTNNDPLEGPLHS